MSTGTDSFDGSKLGAFTRSLADARNHACECEPYVLAGGVTNNSSRCWDLTPYQGPGIARPCSGYWRLIEVGCCYPDWSRDGNWYGAGIVSTDGELLGLPAEFCSRYFYDGFMQLQIGCIEHGVFFPPPWGVGDGIFWPVSGHVYGLGDRCSPAGPCQTLTPLDAFPTATAGAFYPDPNK